MRSQSFTLAIIVVMICAGVGWFFFFATHSNRQMLPIVAFIFVPGIIMTVVLMSKVIKKR